MRGLSVLGLLTVLAVMAITTPSRATPAVFTLADKGRSVTVGLHDTIELKLESNMSDSGYGWELAKRGSPQLKLLKHGSTRDLPATSADGAPILGGSQTQFFTFLAAKPGVAMIKANYNGPAHDAVADTFQLIVTVSAGGK
jgi:predicted secreted protein